MKKHLKIFTVLTMLTATLSFGNVYNTKAVTSNDCDIDRDGHVNALDMTYELRFLCGTITANDISRFDVNNNGIINEVDYLLIVDDILGNI